MQKRQRRSPSPIKNRKRRKGPELKCKVEACNFKSTRPSALKEHLLRTHGIGKWFCCKIDGCNYKSKRSIRLKQHEARIHGSDFPWVFCKVEGCSKKFVSGEELSKHHNAAHKKNAVIYNCTFSTACKFQTKSKYSLQTHIREVHEVGLVKIPCPEKNCKFKAKSTSSLKCHMRTHGIGTRSFPCSFDGCSHIAKTKPSLKRHFMTHGIGITWYDCDIENCKFQTKTSSDLKRHKRDKHQMGVQYFYCGWEGCAHKTKSKTNLEAHVRKVHQKIPKTHNCPFPKCSFKAYYKTDIKNHLSGKHNKDVVWKFCDVKECVFRCKTDSTLKQHKQNIHLIGVKWHHCTVRGCKFKSKQKSALKPHLRNIHDIGIVWHTCNLCEYRAKQNSSLQRHLSAVHDIGKHKCDFCLRNRNSEIAYKDTAGNHKICRECFNKATGKSSRVEIVWSDYLDKVIGKEFLLGSDRSMKTMGGCSRLRPDKLYTGPALVEVDECDEHQHRFGNYSCEDKRISELYDEDGIRGKTMVVLRWNPHVYTPPDGYNAKRKSRKERLEIHAKLKAHLRKNPPKDLISIYYLFYDRGNPVVSQAYPKHFIYDLKDFQNTNKK